jgi:hypothetical protein
MKLFDRLYRSSSARANRPKLAKQRRRAGFLETLEARRLLIATPARFDFGTDTSPVASGYTQLAGATLYNGTPVTGELKAAAGA